MPQVFSAREMIEVAIKEEQTGATFYRALADSTDSEDLAEFAREVAAMEDTHEAKFKKLREEVGEYKTPRESYEGEYDSYMSYLLEGRIFPTGRDGEEMARRQESDEQAVNTAMELERNTLLFYHEMLKFIPEKQHALLEGIIDEERQHVRDFAEYRDAHF